MRLIDADDALERLKKAEQEMKVVSIVGCKAVPMDGVIEFLETRPTVDAVEVVRARWVDNHCTACGMMPMGEELWKHMDIAPPRMECFMDYCPCCGAKMDGGSQ